MRGAVYIFRKVWYNTRNATNGVTQDGKSDKKAENIFAITKSVCNDQKTGSRKESNEKRR